MLLLLAACAPCPTFGEMTVEDVDGTASAEVVATAEAALAGFAAWTGDAGVCVPGIDLIEDVAEPLFMEEGWAAGGRYRGKRRTIQVSTQWPAEVGTSTFHELCHALDRVEGHSEALDWPDAPESARYDGTKATKEDFAEACERGPYDTTLEFAVADRCGTEPLFFDDADRYLAEVVFPEAPRMDLADEPLSLTTRTWGWEGLGVGTALLDAAPYDGGVALLVREPGTKSGDDLVVRLLDATLAEVRQQIGVAVGVAAARAGFVRADAGLYVWMERAHGDGWGAHQVRLTRLDAAGAGPWDVPDLAKLERAAVSGGTLYALGREGALHAWSLDGGEEIDVAPPPTEWPLGIFPLETGAGVVDVLGIHAYDPAADAWVTWSTSSRLVGAWAEAGDGRAIVVSGQVRLLWDGDAWAFLGDPCVEEVDGDVWFFGDVVAVGGGRLLGFPEGGSDSDDDGLVEYTITEMRIGGYVCDGHARLRRLG